ncbi:uncharacterized protein G2W53_026779 [Senna tora]|uniref:SWIM-type domain-containing protein n=1 Tax=Senna tora TaxID=362788 RepID=A0A834TPP2_9FABA|nr:uncharacterized protein G2W53_026779 [Senna tora]
MPITALVQATLYKTANYYHVRQQQALAQIHAGYIYCEEFRNSILKHAAVASACEIKLQNLQDMEFGVQEPYNRQTRQGGRLCIVLLQQSYCDCGEFQSLRFPCAHVLAVCSYLNHEHELYVDPIYRLHNIVAAYNYPFHPIAWEEYWLEVPGQRLRPNPAALHHPGRPRSTRIHNEMDWKEPGEKSKCSLCRGEGHNKKKCPNKKPISVQLMQLGSPSSFTEDPKLSVIRIIHAGFLEGQQILLHVQRILGAANVAYRVRCDPLVQRGSVSSVMALVLCHPVNVTLWFEFKGCAWTPLVQLWRPCILGYGDKAVMQSIYVGGSLWTVGSDSKTPLVRAFFCLLNHIQQSRFLTGISTVGSDPADNKTPLVRGFCSLLNHIQQSRFLTGISTVGSDPADTKSPRKIPSTVGSDPPDRKTPSVRAFYVLFHL